MKLLSIVLLAASLSLATTANALDVLDYLTDKDGKYTGPSVAENVAKMDKDNSGFADVEEVRAFLELKHGKGYQKALLDRWEIAANTTSCGTSFVKELVEE